MKAAVEAFKKKFTGDFYHGSPSPSIKSFNPAKSKKDFPIQDVTFVSPNPDFASSFAPNKTGATMYPVNVNMGKHFDPNTPEGNEAIKQFLLDKYQKEAGTDYFEEAIKQKHEHLMDNLTDPLNTWKTLESPEMLNYLRSSGHDTFKVVEGGNPRNRFGITGTGSAAIVMSTVTDILRDFLTMYKGTIKSLSFSADERSRQTLYAKMTKRLLPDWQLTKNHKQFILTSPTL